MESQADIAARRQRHAVRSTAARARQPVLDRAEQDIARRMQQEDSMRRSAEASARQQRENVSRGGPGGRTAAAQPSVGMQQPGRPGRASEALRAGAGRVRQALSIAPDLTNYRGVRGGMRFAARGTGATTALVSAAGSGVTDTSYFRQRIGMDPNASSLPGDLMARTVGTLEDLGNTVTMGGAGAIGGAIGRGVADFMDERRARGTPDAVMRPASTQRGALIGQEGRATPVSPRPGGFAPGPDGTVTDTQRLAAPPAQQLRGQHGERVFTDDPVRARAEAGRGGFVQGAPAMQGIADVRSLQERGREAERDARRQTPEDFFNSVMRQRAIAGGTWEERNQRQAAFNQLRRTAEGRGFPPPSARARREATLAMAEFAREGQHQAIGQQRQTPAQARGQVAEAEQQEQQAIASLMQNQQAQRAQQILQQLQALPADAPEEQRRALESSYMAALGQQQDPRFSLARIQTGGDEFNPVIEQIPFDQRSGQFIYPDRQPQQVQGGPTLEEFLQAARGDPRNRGVSDEDLTSYYRQTYGAG